jgi:hypothetical protein
LSGSAGNENSPSGPVLVVREEFEERRFTRAPEMAAPLGSNTEPVTVTCCAAAGLHRNAVTSNVNRQAAQCIQRSFEESIFGKGEKRTSKSVTPRYSTGRELAANLTLALKTVSSALHLGHGFHDLQESASGV